MRLNERVYWEAFRPDQNQIIEKPRKSNAETKHIDIALCSKSCFTTPTLSI